MKWWQKNYNQEISFSHSLIIIVFFFFVSTVIIYYTATSNPVTANNYSSLLINKKNRLTETSQKIMVSRPQPNSLISRSFVLAGRVNGAAELIYYQLFNDLDEILTQGSIVTNNQQPTALFFTEINLEQFPTNLRPAGKLVIFTVNPLNQAKENLIIIPVKLSF